MHRQLIRTVLVVEPHRIPALAAGLVGLRRRHQHRAHTSHYRRREAVPAQHHDLRLENEGGIRAACPDLSVNGNPQPLSYVRACGARAAMVLEGHRIIR
jgi:hypothetical protein